VAAPLRSVGRLSDLDLEALVAAMETSFEIISGDHGQ
jgi:hypothetical protein